MVRNKVAHGQPFGLGLRLSAVSASELSNPQNLETFKNFMMSENLYVFTVNGFPYGKFHDVRVKDSVYLPDWRNTLRRDYTIKLADVMSELMLDNVNGSISTVPGTYKPLVNNEQDKERMAELMIECVAHMVRINRCNEREIHIGLEPEPDCFLETTDECISFFEEVLLTHGREYLARLLACSSQEAELHIRRHLGVCLDTCHAAIQYEDLSECVKRYGAAGMRISKIQLSAALETENDKSGREALSRFEEPVYLHQVKARRSDGFIGSWPDIGAALPGLTDDSMYETIRAHFHVPVCWTGEFPLRTTSVCLNETFWRLIRGGNSGHLEIETYTLDVLPDALKISDVTSTISGEFAWVLDKFNGVQPTV